MAAFGQKHAHTVTKALGIQQSDVESIAPCTPLQEGMISRSLTSDKPVYFSGFYYRLGRQMDGRRLKEAWAKVIDGSQILRTRFVSTVDGFAQVALRKVDVPWETTVVQCSEPTNLGFFQDWWHQNRATLSNPLKLVHYHSSADSLGVFAHHALFDEWSLGLLLDRVAKEYRRVSPIQYGPPFQSVLSRGPLCRVEGAEAFWKSRSNPFPGRVLPVTARAEANPGLVSVDYTSSLLEKTRRRLQTTHQALLQACWLVVLSSWIGPSVDLGLLVSGRATGVDMLEETMGPLFNTIPFHADIEERDTLASLVKKCQEFNTAALPYQHTPLRDIIKWSGSTKETPLFEVLFSFQRERRSLDQEGDIQPFGQEASSPDVSALCHFGSC